MKDINGFEGIYAITTDGKVWAYPRQRSSKYGKFLKTRIAKTRDGRRNSRLFETINLYDKNGKRSAHQIHRLVAIAYIENIDKKPFVNHIDGNSLNNRYDNLEWVTCKENSNHAFNTGLQRKKYTNSEIMEIRKICKYHSCRKIAKEYRVHHGTIWDIYKENTYK